MVVMAAGGRRKAMKGLTCLAAADNFIDMHHVAMFVPHVEQIDYVRQLGALIGAFLGRADVKAARIAIDDAGAHATCFRRTRSNLARP